MAVSPMRRRALVVLSGVRLAVLSLTTTLRLCFIDIYGLNATMGGNKVRELAAGRAYFTCMQRATDSHLCTHARRMRLPPQAPHVSGALVNVMGAHPNKPSLRPLPLAPAGPTGPVLHRTHGHHAH
mgnify:CR=1 FL=1